MANRVLIEIVGQDQGLDEANAKLDTLSQKEKQILADMKSLEQERIKAKAYATTAEQMSAAEQKYGKMVEDNVKRLKDVRTEQNNVKKSIEDLSNAQKAMPGKIIAENTTKSFKALKRELDEQLRKWNDWSDTGKAAYDKLLAKSGEMNDKMGDTSRMIQYMGSDTKGFDTLVEGTQAVAGGFSVAQGAMALFGDENEDLQKIMVKLQAAIAISTGLQQLGNAVQRDSNLMMGIKLIQDKAAAKAKALSNVAEAEGVATTTAGTVATEAETAATELQTAATGKATIAQRLFNLVAEANPYVLLAVAILTVVGALVAFTVGSKEAEKAQESLNNEFENGKRIINQNNSDLDLQVKLLQAVGAKESDIIKAKRKANNENIALAENALNDIEKNAQKSETAWRKFWGLGITDEAKKTIQDQKDLLSGLYNDQKQLNEDSTVNDEKTRFENAKKNAIAMAEYRVLMTKEGSKAELEAKIEALRVERDQELKDENLTAGEILKIKRKTEIDIRNLRDEFRIKTLQDDLSAINAGVLAAKEGSLDEYSLKVISLEKQKDIDLKTNKNNADKKKEINAKYLKDLDTLTDDFVYKISKREIDIKKSEINAKLSAVQEGSSAEFDLKKQLLEEDAKLQILDVENTVKNEKEKAAKIKEINAKLIKDKNQNSFDKNIAEINAENTQYELINKDLYARGIISKQEYDDRMNSLTIETLNEEIDARRAAGKDTTDLEQKLADERIKIAEQEAEAKSQVMQESFSLISDIGNALFSYQSDQLSQQLDDLDHYYTTDADAAKNNANLKLISEQEYNKRQLSIKRKQAQVEKNQAIFTAGLEYAKGMISAAASGAQFGLAAAWAIPMLMGMMTAAFVVQIASITSKPLPKYWKGRKGGDGEYAVVGEHGPELMWIPQMAGIMPAHDTQRAMSGDMQAFERWNMPPIDSWIPLPDISQRVTQEINRKDTIDYDRLASKIGEHVGRNVRIPKGKNVTVNVDKSGITIEDGNTKTKVLNKKYGI